MSSKRKIDADELVRDLTAEHQVGTYANLCGRVVDQPVSVNGQILRGVDFSDTEFLEVVDFTGCIFIGLSWFRNSVFKMPANFSKCRFLNDARFDDAIFETDVKFNRATFMGMAAFDNCHIEGDVSFSNVQALGNVSMSNVRFSGKSDFSSTNMMGGLWCPKGAFGRPHGLSTLELYGRCVTAQSNLRLPSHHLTE